MPHTRTTSLCARVCNLYSFLAKAHSYTLAIERHSVLQTRNVTRESPRTYRISMGTILFLETIVHFHSYEHYKVFHTGEAPSWSRFEDTNDDDFLNYVQSLLTVGSQAQGSYLPVFSVCISSSSSSKSYRSLFSSMRASVTDFGRITKFCQYLVSEMMI
jgi:hypothetical protein